MAEGTVLQSLAGAVIAISAETPPSGVYDAAGYADTGIDWTPIGKVETYGEHGGQAQINTFTPVDTAVIEKFKGSKDYGQMAVVLGHLPSDAGQDIVAAAFESQNRYSLRITYPLRAGESANEKHYLDVLVSSFRYSDGDANAIRKLNVSFDVCRAPVVVAAT